MRKRALVGVMIGVVGLGAYAAVRVEAAGSRRVELRLHQIKAVDECGGKIEWGHDKITLGAVQVDQGVARVRTHNAGKFGHDGSTTNYKTPRTFLRFALEPGVTKRVHAYLVLAERDALGGFGEWLEAFRTEIQTGMKKSAKGEKGGGVSATQVVQTAATVAATGLTTATAIEIGKVAYSKVLPRFKDDIFNFHHVQYSTSDGSGSTPKTLTFKAKDCKYTVTYSWAE